MPPAGRLSSSLLSTVRDWIENGATLEDDAPAADTDGDGTLDDNDASDGDDALEANEAACNASAGVGETLELKMIVDGGGTTISELQIESVVSGKEVT